MPLSAAGPVRGYDIVFMWKKRIREYDIEILLCLLLLVRMLLYVAEKEFWYDEAVMLGFISRPHFSDLFLIYAGMEVSNLPLYAMLQWVIYHVFPPMNIFLLLPGILMTTGGVWMLSALARKKSGRAASVAVLLLSLVSATVVIRIGLELRAYCLMFFAVCFHMYIYQKDGKKETVLFFLRLLSGLLLIYSHYYGVLFFAIWGLATLYKCIRREWPIRKLIPQILAGLLFLPWFFRIAKTAFGKAGGFWIAPPEFSYIPDTFGYLMGSTYSMLILYAVMCIVVFLHIAKEKKWLSFESFCLFVPFLVILGMFVYSRYLSSGGGLFLYKYFIAICPCMILTAADGIQIFCAFLWKKKHILALLGMFLMLPAFCFSYRQMWIEEDHLDCSRYAGFAKSVTENGDLSEPGTVLFLTHHDSFEGLSVLGAYDYYFVRRGVMAENMKCFDVHDLQEEMDALGNRADKVYVFGDEDMIEYEGSRFVCTGQVEKYCLTVFEKTEDIDD